MTTSETSPAPTGATTAPADNALLRGVHLVERFFHPNYTGLVVATVLFAWSMTPSLLPRDWFFQGLISGINATIGYGLGCLLAWAWRRWVVPKVTVPARFARLWAERPPWTLLAVRIVIVVIAVIVAVLMTMQSARWQREITDLMGMESVSDSGYLRTALLGVAVVGVLIWVARLIARAVRAVSNALNTWVRIPASFARPLGVVVVAVVAVLLFNGVLAKTFFAVANSAFSARNSHTSPHAVQPVLPERSGSPESLAKWETLGSEGRWFVANAPTALAIGQVTGKPAREPIRVYTGLESADGFEAQTDLAVAELDRTKAFEREVLVVVTTTGTGWVDSTSAESVELMFNGDTALVATQYSYLPSALSFLSDRDKSMSMGRMLFDKVHERWSALPPETRPKLLVYGESLGSQGSEGAFSGLADIRNRTDGVLWVGPPNSNRLWSEFVARRDPGTEEISPIFADGLSVRFAMTKDDLARPSENWTEPRIVYLQHASDPVVWWSPDLLFSQPDWLGEKRGPDVSPAMSWYPIVTFWQVAADLPRAQSVSNGHGHNYGNLVPDAWAAVARPPDYTPELAQRIRLFLEESAATEHQLK
ncbi:alpha/beta hydrolase [Nocardia caishijiensis]|uniref:Membrane protein n=1 Tax=Nocardia caishijiensis TaxID=184756 RepID=A0ABQ6YQI3_9NOCA|nr:alpha/beta-hydrolase family protein [Nocardia caishijiensis]KAF0847986.1 putative membrane protein [Nocardia caishijiensis]